MVQIPDVIFVSAPGAGHYPTRWARWSDLRRLSEGPRVLGLACTDADLNRFAARYRAAHAFSGISLDGYSSAIEDGYSASIRLFMVYAAFDAACRSKKCEPFSAGAWIDEFVGVEAVRSARGLDAGDRLMNAILPHLRKALVPRLTQYMSGNTSSVLPPFMAIRHLFVHGVLTPSFARTDPNAYAALCNHLSQTVLAALDDDFTTLVDAIQSR